VALGTIAGMTGTYRLARRCSDPPGALTAAVLYGYAPYVVRDIFIRGDLSEYLALGFLPWAVGSVLALRAPDGRRVGAVILTGALAILSHNIVGLFTGLAMAGTGAVTVLAAPDRRRTAVAAALGGAGALLVTAFFWAPALYEKRFVQIDILTTGYYELGNHFVSPAQLAGPGAFPHARSQALPMTPEIGYPLLAGLALFLAFGLRRVRAAAGRETLIVAGGLLLAGLVMVTRLGAPVYRVAPLLTFVQFPWRFLSLVALGAAVLGGFGLDAAVARLAGRWRYAAAGALGAAAIVLSLPLLAGKPNFPLSPRVTDPAELRKQPNTTTGGEYLPRAVQDVQPPRRFEHGVRISGNARVVSGERRAGRYDLVVDADEPVSVDLRDVAYPGWTASVDGARVPLETVEGTGHLRLPLEAGRHEIRVRLEPTPIRRVARLVSLASLLLLAGAGWASARRGRGARGRRADAREVVG